ncbi:MULTISPECIES: IclR family transcriptional regulator [Limibacillus]|uniref:DNA-binding IclR family transcriptional regulator n=1 Tax=Limibacillus halophilus TaxID=1579333 RepID=A0A839SNK4_9PROT|nr:IclR family transcriptional regulator [Limibacillus halophilus]MBB3063758.1 DNA-binding IclR family transcriptional regulator [Limibacillus halophilus]
MAPLAGMKTVRHAIVVLRCFSVAESLLGVNEIARRTGLHKSSVSRLVATLEEAHLLERDTATKRLRLGDGLLTIAAPLFSKMGFLNAVRPVLEKLSQTTEETAYFNIWDGSEAVVVDQAVGPNAVTHFAPLGMRNPAHCTATGKVLLAFASESEVDAVLSVGLHKYTPSSVTDPVTLREQLADIRANGVALNIGELASDVGAIAAIVRKEHGAIAGAIAVSVPLYRFGRDRQEELRKMVLEAAKSLSQRLS